MYELTHTRASDSTIYLIADDTGFPAISASEGTPREKKSTCTTNTSNIATIRSNSKLDWRGDLLTPPIKIGYFIHYQYIIFNIINTHAGSRQVAINQSFCDTFLTLMPFLIEAIACPTGNIVFDVIGDIIEIALIAYNVVMIAWLPTENNSILPCAPRHM